MTIVPAFLLLLVAENPMADFDRLWNFDDPAGTERKFRELLPAAERSGDADALLQLKTQIARTLGLQRKFAEAHALLDEVEKGLTPALKVARVRCLLERGRVLNTSGNPEKARPLFLEAYEFGAREKLESWAIDAAHMMGIVEPPEKQIGWTEKALALAESSTDERARRWRASLHNNLGFSLLDLGKREAALAHFETALAIRKEQKTPAQIRIAEWCVAHALRLLGRIDEALAIQRRLEEEQRGKDADGYVFEEIGECLLAKGDAKGAEEWFAKAWQALRSNPDVPKDRLERMQRLGKVS